MGRRNILAAVSAQPTHHTILRHHVPPQRRYCRDFRKVASDGAVKSRVRREDLGDFYKISRRPDRYSNSRPAIRNHPSDGPQNPQPTHASAPPANGRHRILNHNRLPNRGLRAGQVVEQFRAASASSPVHVFHQNVLEFAIPANADQTID